MPVFIDESGDPGFKIGKGSSPTFVTTTVIFDSYSASASTQAKLDALALRLGVKPEFKFSKLRDGYRDEFFREVGTCSFRTRSFRTRSVVVQKYIIYSENLRTAKDSFYKFFLRMMMQHSNGSLIDSKVVIDGSRDRVFKKELSKYLRKHMNLNSVSKFSLKDSKNDRLIQLADMCAGAIGCSYRTERPDSNRWRAVLQRSSKIEDV